MTVVHKSLVNQWRPLIHQNANYVEGNEVADGGCTLPAPCPPVGLNVWDQWI